MKLKVNIKNKKGFVVNNSYEGESIEHKVERIMSNKEPISDGAPLIYTDRDEGVLAEYDVRTDRWEVAIDAMDKVHKTNIAKKEEAKKAKAEAEKAVETTEDKIGD